MLLQPDGTFTFAIRELSLEPARASSPGLDPTSRGIHPESVPTLVSWENALLRSRPSGKVVVQSEESVKQGAGSTFYRTLLLEMETGANNSKDLDSKIKAYNRVLRAGEGVWTGVYGIRPRVGRGAHRCADRTRGW